jgi:hypothetical protein
LLSIASLFVAIVFGEAAMVGVVSLGRHAAGGANVGAWLLATTVIAIVGYLALGLPQIRAWESGTRTGLDTAFDNGDPRVRLAARSLSTGGLVAFLVASVLGGSLAVGWFYARRRDPRARSLAWTAAWLLAAVWSAVYLGLLAWAL